MKREGQGLSESMAVSERLFHLWLFLKTEQEAKLDAGTRRGESKIVHFRPLFREVLVNALCLDTEGKSRDRAPLSGREPRNNPSLLFPVSTPRYEDSYDCRESKTVHFCHLTRDGPHTFGH